MGTNVAQVLESEATSLFKRLCENQDIANAIMSFIRRIYLICKEQGKPIESVELGSVTESGGDFRMPIAFHSIHITKGEIWTANRYDDLKFYMAARNRAAARILENNVSLVVGFRSIVEAVEKFCERKRMPFKDFKIKKAFITPDNRTCVLRSGVDTLDKWGR